MPDPNPPDADAKVPDADNGGAVNRYESHRPIGQPKHDPPSPAKASPGSVIVVDSSPLSLLTLAGILHHEGYECVCARTAESAMEAAKSGPRDLVVWDVGDDAPGAIAGLEAIRRSEGYAEMPAVFIADQRWVGLEKKTEAMTASTRCLFKPIDPKSLTAVVQQSLWLPNIAPTARRRPGTSNRPGWITLDD